MTRNLDNQNSSDSDLKSKKNLDQSFTQNSACYRGFPSIDQEMEREIAMQWFKPAGKKSRIFHEITLFRSRS